MKIIKRRKLLATSLIACTLMSSQVYSGQPKWKNQVLRECQIIPKKNTSKVVDVYAYQGIGSKLELHPRYGPGGQPAENQTFSILYMGEYQGNSEFLITPEHSGLCLAPTSDSHNAKITSKNCRYDSLEYTAFGIRRSADGYAILMSVYNNSYFMTLKNNNTNTSNQVVMQNKAADGNDYNKWSILCTNLKSETIPLENNLNW